MFTAYEKCTCMQRAKKVVSDRLGLVDFAIALANSVFNLGATVKMTSGLVNASFS